MNISQVKTLWTLETLLNQLGYMPDKKKSRGHDLWFRSPFRPGEQEASFHIHTGKNIWKDFGLSGQGSGGDMIAFVQTYLREQGQSSSVADVLNWFRGLSHIPAPLPSRNLQSVPEAKTEPFKLLSVKPIFSKALLDYLTERGISHQTGQRYLKQVYFFHHEGQRNIYGVGMVNRAGGYDVRNPLGFKGVVGPKDISFIAGAAPTGTVEVFEGAFDFLSRMELYQKEGQPAPQHDCIVLHSNMLYAAAAALIKEKGYVRALLWLDNDKGGEQGRAAIEGEFTDGLQVVFEPQNELYRGYKDLNAWLTGEKR